MEIEFRACLYSLKLHVASTPEKLFENSLKQVEAEKRGIVLMHDVHAQTAVFLPYFLTALKEAGYTAILFQPEHLPEADHHVP